VKKLFPLTVLAALVLFAALAAVPLARADGDPASDYLLTQSTFVPPDLGISTADAARLSATVEAARSSGYVIHVALIGSAYDLGSVVALNRKPKLYARFLGEELAFVYRGRVLVVMPNGLGVSKGGKALPAQQKLLDRLPVPGSSGRRLVQAGIEGVRVLAAAAGVQVPPPGAAGASGGGSSGLVWGLAGGAIAAVIALAGGFLALRRRRAT